MRRSIGAVPGLSAYSPADIVWSLEECMARICKKCGEKLFPTDTFCGFCGEPVTDISEGMERFSYTPRSLVGDDALTKNEREKIELAKRRFMQEAAASAPTDKSGKNVNEQAAKLSAEKLQEKKAQLLAAKKAEEQRKASEEAARLEAERAEAERKAAEEAERIASEIRAAEEEIARLEALKAEAEQKEEEARLETARLEALRHEREKKAAEEKPSETDDFYKDILGELGKTGAYETDVSGESADSTDEFEEEASDEAAYDGYEEDFGMTADIEPEESEEAFNTADERCDVGDGPNAVWEEAEKRAKAEQREADRLRRKRRLNEKPKNLNRDIVLLSVGIVILVLLLTFLLRSELKGLRGNDADRNDGVSTEQNSTPGTTDSSQETGESRLPSDYGKAWDGSVAADFLKGEGTESDPYQIVAGSELAYLAAEVNRGVNFSGVYFSLENDLDLSGLEWTPIGYYYQDTDKGDLVYSFNGSFAGNGHKIYNYKISDLEVVSQLPNFSPNKVCGLFGTTYGAVISDLIIEQCTVDIQETGQGEILTGALVGFAYDTEILQCTVTAEVKADTVERAAAGIAVGAMSNGKMEDVVVGGNVSVTTDTGINDAGLIGGYAKGTSFENITASGKVVSVSSGNLYSGGIAGYGSEISVSNAQISIELDSETLSAEAKLMTGGAVGYYISGQDSLVNVSGNIAAAGAGVVYAGGAYGYAEESVSGQLTAEVAMGTETALSGANTTAGGVYGCFDRSVLDGTSVAGSIASKAVDANYTGGIAGQGYEGSIKGITAGVNVSAEAEKEESAVVMCGGAAGQLSKVSLEEITATGNVAVISQFDGHAGGIAGYINGGVFNQVAASGKITNTSKSGVSSGGFAGYAEGEYTVTECTGTTDRTNDGKNVYDDDFIAIDANQSEE